MFERILWAVACVVLPVAWGVLVHALFERMRSRTSNDDDRHFPDYQI